MLREHALLMNALPGMMQNYLQTLQKTAAWPCKACLRGTHLGAAALFPILHKLAPGVLPYPEPCTCLHGKCLHGKSKSLLRLVFRALSSALMLETAFL